MFYPTTPQGKMQPFFVSFFAPASCSTWNASDGSVGVPRQLTTLAHVTTSMNTPSRLLVY